MEEDNVPNVALHPHGKKSVDDCEAQVKLWFVSTMPGTQTHLSRVCYVSCDAESTWEFASADTRGFDTGNLSETGNVQETVQKCYIKITERQEDIHVFGYHQLRGKFDFGRQQWRAEQETTFACSQES
eukprot:gb/GECG01012129.1/.p1 GENE.gb/GECG01012129.1/~~gb/GECG01012129.1/.p1  ORF type:complete len:128 (+),score=18.29 gb/GECG01012129.1/:1-384(+)